MKKWRMEDLPAPMRKQVEYLLNQEVRRLGEFAGKRATASQRQPLAGPATDRIGKKTHRQNAICHEQAGILWRGELSGQVHGGKNAMGVTQTGIHYPKPLFRKWRDEAMGQITPPDHPIDVPCRAIIRYTAGDKRTRDVPAVTDALFHVLERAGVVKNDGLIKDADFRYAYDKAAPGVAIELWEKNARPHGREGSEANDR